MAGEAFFRSFAPRLCAPPESVAAVGTPVVVGKGRGFEEDTHGKNTRFRSLASKADGRLNSRDLLAGLSAAIPLAPQTCFNLQGAPHSYDTRAGRMRILPVAESLSFSNRSDDGGASEVRSPS